MALEGSWQLIPAEDLFLKVLPMRYCCFVAPFIPVSHSDLQTLIKSHSTPLMYISVVSLRDVWNIHDKIGGILSLPLLQALGY